MPDRYALSEIAGRIAFTESRAHQLRYRVSRLQEQGSDARREQEVLHALTANLGEMYRRQSAMRRTSWIMVD